MPDQGLAPWVSANDKPSATAGSKPVTGDATERRVKGEVMQLPARDRRRIKDLATNEVGCSLLSSWQVSSDSTNLRSVSRLWTRTKPSPVYSPSITGQKPREHRRCPKVLLVA